MSLGLTAALVLAAAALGVVAGVSWVQARLRRVRRDAAAEAERILAEARQRAEQERHTLVVEGKEAAFRAKEAWEREEARRREEIERAERRLADRAEQLERKAQRLEEREQVLQRRQAELVRQRRLLHAERETLDRERRDVDRRLEQLAGLTRDEARALLLQQLEEEARAEAQQRAREIREEARRQAEREAREIVALAIQRVAVDQALESTVSVVALPSDDMKGRIIGREGRNIRAFEQLTGVDLVIDDTPEVVVLSCFDPVRREVARLALERLVADGRIHPGRIEEIVSRSRKDVERGMVEAAEEALYELGIHGVHPEIVKVLGRLKYRTSYGQNQLQHAREVAWLAGTMAAELGFDVTLAKRAGLLHDIGKGLTHEHEGSHVELGWELCRRYGEPDVVLNAIRAHHDEEPHRYPETFLVTAADAISGARPGARREMFETYVKRLERMEQIANSFPGVERCFAVQAGRELRILVLPDRVNDDEAVRLADQVARRIEEELQYPGQIKVVVIRETRATNFAR